uniref:Conserved hypothetical plastid protein n=1 Tax=Porphyridium purpureum TaxID=35688 RepID=W0RZ70_PORPP|nr:conserved hypothetical plastid protein [Porphyridium purpureum]ATJ02964.1 hypothetical protein [Porphyridium purpureum]BAO23747.1 conserved hypothetical plastid protein [Porphyridium purpureum]
MCICINCHYINKCNTYYFIDKEHGNINRNLSNSFMPQSSIIDANIYKNKNLVNIDWDVTECLSFVEKPGIWLNKIKK